MVDRGELDINRILKSNKAIFKLNGCKNRHNSVYWPPEKPKVTIDAHINLTRLRVWCANSAEGIVGRFFFDGTVAAQSYLAMPQQQLLPLLQHLGGAEGLYFHQDGAPAHYAKLVGDWLDANLPNQGIGRREPLE